MKNIREQAFSITRLDREKRNGHKGLVIWLTGLSGSGKSTLSNALEKALHQKGISTFNLDGDNTRLGINKDLGFSLSDRTENIRRVAEIARLFRDAGIVVITSFISPLENDRKAAKAIIGEDDFVEVFVDCPLSVCEERDVKGLYAKARRGELKNFTGIDSPFEIPVNPSVLVETNAFSAEECVSKIIAYVLPKLNL